MEIQDEPIQTPTLSEFAEMERLSEEDISALEHDLGEMIYSAYGQLDTLREKVSRYRSQYEGELTPKRLPWMSNMNVPITQYMVDAATDNLDAAMFGAEPIFEVESVDPTFDDYANQLENYLEFWHNYMKLRTKASMAIKDALITGQSWLRPGVRRTGKPTVPLGPEPVVIADLDVVPTVDYVTTENMVVIPADTPSIAQAQGVFARLELRWDDIVQGVEEGRFLKRAIEKLENRYTQGKEDQVVSQRGVDQVQPKNIWHARIPVLEGYIRWKPPKGKREKRLLVLVAMDPEESPACTVLSVGDYASIYGDAEIFIPLIPDPRPRTIWGKSIVETLSGLQHWMNATFNQSTDAVTISLLPPMEVPVGMRMAQNIKWGPMERWPTAVSGSIRPITVGPALMGTVQSAMGMIELVRQMAERAVGVSDLTVGRQIEERRTAFEISAVIEAGSRRFDRMVSRLQHGIEEWGGLEGYARSLIEIIRNFLPRRPVVYPAAKEGESRWTVIQPFVVHGRYNFIPKGTTGASNPEVRLRRALATKDEILRSPFMQFSPLDTPESALEKAQRLWRAQRDVLTAMGDRHVDLKIGAMPQTSEEAMRIVAAINPQIAMAIAQQTKQSQAPPAFPAGEERPFEVAPEGRPVPGTPPAEGTFGGGEETPEELGGAPRMEGAGF